MNKPHKYAEVIKAWADGAEVEWRLWSSAPWLPLTNGRPHWDAHEYRVKPREPREFYLNVYPGLDGLVLHKSREEADRMATAARNECIKVREVIE